MKKILAILFTLTLFTGCSVDLMNTPTKKVEELFNKYQTLDDEVLKDLNTVIDEDEAFTTETRENYRNVMKKHYQNLTYEVKDEIVNGDEATVVVEIEVSDYSKISDTANQYYLEHPDDFKDDLGNFIKSKLVEYQIGLMEKATDKVKYTLELIVKKENGKWQVAPLSSDDLNKINGTYKY